MNYTISETDSETHSYLLNYVSSIRVRNGCTFRAYIDADAEELLFRATDDMENLGDYDGQMSSYSCHCETSNMFIFNFSFISLLFGAPLQCKLRAV